MALLVVHAVLVIRKFFGPWHSMQWAIFFDGSLLAAFQRPSKYSLR